MDCNTTNSRSMLVTSAYVFLPLFLFHQADHIRRGLGTASTQLVALGTVGGYLGITTLTLILVHHRLAPQIATFVGFLTAVGFIAAHWLPTWGPASDSFVSHHVDWVSWVASIGEVGGGILLGTAGLVTWKSQRRAAGV